jgi:integrase
MFLSDEILPEPFTLLSNPVRLRDRPNRALRALLNQPKNPYTDAEIQRMLDHCRPMNEKTYESYYGKLKVVQIRRVLVNCDGDDLADFIEISHHTGLRISDVAGFHIDRLTANGEVNLRCAKNGQWVSVWIPEFVRAMIRHRAKVFGPVIFGEFRSIDSACEKWRRRLNKLWAASGPWVSKPCHHRFRHTFVRRLLQSGVSLRRVSELIGDTEDVIEQCYSQWMPERQEALTRDLERAFANAPRFKR